MRFRLGNEVKENNHWEKKRKECADCAWKSRNHGNTCGKSVGSERKVKGVGKRMWEGYWKGREKEKSG